MAAERETVVDPAPLWLRGLVSWMDDAIAIPGTNVRIGLDPLFGLLAPGVGDGVAAATHVVILVAAFRAGVPRATMVRMAVNAAIDSALGALPVVGDLFDAGFRANRRNLELLERMHQRGKPRATLGDYAFLGGVLGVLALVLLLPLLVVAGLLTWVFKT